MDELRDPRFFMSKVDDESLGDTHGKSHSMEFSPQKMDSSAEKAASPPIEKPKEIQTGPEMI